MPVRKIIKIDEERCDGCGLCIPSCAEGALQIVNGKARLVEERFCDGLGDCLGECPQGAITMIEREADPFDEEAVEQHLHKQSETASEPGTACSAVCAGSMVRELKKDNVTESQEREDSEVEEAEAELSHWPVQLHLVSPQARFLQGKELLIAADCVPFAYAAFHQKLLRGKSLLIGCPKLDDVACYHDKLVEIFKNNNIPHVTLAYMEVPCCFGLSKLVRSAIETAKSEVPVEEIVIGVDGSIKSTTG